MVAEVPTVLEQHVNSQNTSADESRSEHHIQNSNKETSFESEPDFRKSPVVRTAKPVPAQGKTEISFPLGLVLQARPDIIGRARGGISNWRDLFVAAALVRTILGISPNAWDEACEVMGMARASVVIAALLQRGAAIQSPGGYLRSLTRREADGSFSLGPMLMALLSARKRQSDTTVLGDGDHPSVTRSVGR